MSLASWENSSIILTSLDSLIPTSELEPMQAKVERVESTRRVARKRVMEILHRIDLSLPLGTTTWGTETLLSDKSEPQRTSSHTANANTVVSEEDWSQYTDRNASSTFDHLAPSCYQMALQVPAKSRNAMKKESTFSIIWDSGASISIYPNKDDFVGPMVASPGIGTRLNGIIKGLSVQGRGYVMWQVLDTSGQLCALKVSAYYVPQARIRLLSTTILFHLYPGVSISIEDHQLTLGGIDGPGGSNSVVPRVNPFNNLPMTTAYSYSDAGSVPEALNAIITTVSTDNMNLSEAQKELVR